MEMQLMQAMLKKHERERNVVKVLSMRSEPAVSKGNNFMSDVWRSKLTLLLGSGKKTIRSFIVKYMPSSGAGKRVATEAFKNEINMYVHVLNQMDTLMNDYKESDDKLWCELIGFRRHDIIILEDLKEKNFFVANRQNMLDFDYAVLCIRGLARFHAMSKVLIKNGQLPLEDYGKYFFAEERAAIAIHSQTIYGLAEAVKSDWGDEWVEYSDKLKSLSENCASSLAEMIKFDESRFNVINHGDIWTNNMMFRCEENSMPSGVKFLDFQCIHYNSFAWDITYFLYTSVKWPVRKDRYDEFVDEYYETLNRKLLLYGFLDGEIPTRDEIAQELERLRLFGLIVMCSVHAITLANSGDADPFSKNINPKIYLNKIFMDDVKGDLIYCSETGLL